MLIDKEDVAWELGITVRGLNKIIARHNLPKAIR